MPRPPILTSDPQRFCRWRTRQAATQFKNRWRLEDLHVYDIQFADVLPGPLPREQLAGVADAAAALPR